MVDSGRCIVRRSPATAALSSLLSDSVFGRLRSEVDRRGEALSASSELRGVTSGRLMDDFSESMMDGEG